LPDLFARNREILGGKLMAKNRNVRHKLVYKNMIFENKNIYRLEKDVKNYMRNFFKTQKEVNDEFCRIYFKIQKIEDK
jgi:hypothetical protein